MMSTTPLLRLFAATKSRRSSVLLVPLVAVTALALTACGGGGDVAAAPTPTATVTVPGPTATVTKTVQVRVTKTVTPSPTASQEPGQPETATAESQQQDASGDFDRPYLIKTAGWVRNSVKDVDSYMRDGIAVSSALYNLTDAYGYMEHAGTPPGVSSSLYLARLRTLATFTSDAADMYAGDPQTATAKYVVARQQTGLLFEQINSAIGTDLTLPPR